MDRRAVQPTSTPEEKPVDLRTRAGRESALRVYIRNSDMRFPKYQNAREHRKKPTA